VPIGQRSQDQQEPNFRTGDDLSRDVYCVLGMPIDVGAMPSVLRNIETAAAKRMSFFISTPNLNSLVTMQTDPDFREVLFQSDLCPPDGMPIIWIARLLGIPIRGRVAGSDIFDALKTEHSSAKPLKVFLFGGAEGVAAAACQALNAQPCGLHCVGSHFPGFESVDEMSRDDIINKINSTNADFLVVALGAKKGQLWLQRNRRRLLIPVRSHFGAVINFQAGTVWRAPPIMRTLGLEWLWRIKEEPYLWRRYWNDGGVLLRLLFTRVLPLALWTRWLRMVYEREGQNLVVTQKRDWTSVTLSLSGPATGRHVEMAVPVFRDAILTGKQITIDFSNTSIIDSRFLGLLLMLRKTLKGSGADPIFLGPSPRLKSIFHLNALEFLFGRNA
jgi:N-acetylglucosaminyldiphosphoundecaprenol N-acetyl-beta-D-mannosaminyltransferase